MTGGSSVARGEIILKWVYRILVLLAAIGFFIVCYIVTRDGTHRSDSTMVPFALMVSGMYLLGMRMITENIDRYLWKVVLASLSLVLVFAIIFF